MQETSIRKVERNLISLIAEDSAFLTAGNESEGVNTMTVNWGGLGYLWHKNFCFIAVRKSRYTLRFIKNNMKFSLSFFGDDKKEELIYCGSHSGRDGDKLAKCGLKVGYEDDIPHIEGAKIVINCKIMYTDSIKPEKFMDESIYERWYTEEKEKGDMHEFFIAEIIGVYTDEC